MNGESSPLKRKKPGRSSNKAKQNSKQQENNTEQRQTGKKRRGRPPPKPQEQDNQSLQRQTAKKGRGRPPTKPKEQELTLDVEEGKVLSVDKKKKKLLKSKPDDIVQPASKAERLGVDEKNAEVKPKAKRVRPGPRDNGSYLIAEDSFGRKKIRRISRERTSKKEYVVGDAKGDLGHDYEDFSSCQKDYLNLIERWKNSIMSKSANDELWMDLVDAVANFSSSFILHHNLWDLLQESVSMMEELEIADLESFMDFRRTFQQVYEEKIMNAQGDQILEVENENGQISSAVELSKMQSQDVDDDGKEGLDASEGISDNIHEDYLSSNDEDMGSDAEYTGRNRNLDKIKASKKTKVKPTKKGVKVKHKMESVITEKQKRQKEQVDFSKCEQLYQPLIKKWKSSLNTKNVEELQILLKEADKVVDKFSASFIVEYDLSGIMKTTKNIMKQAELDLTLSGAIKAKLKKTYEAKAPLMPKGFRPKKNVLSDELPKERTDDSVEIGEETCGVPIKNDHIMKAPESPRDIENDKLTIGSSKILVSVVGETKNTSRSKIETSDELKGEGVRPPLKANKPKNFFLKNLMKSSTQENSSSHTGVDVAKTALTKQEKGIVPAWVIGPATMKPPVEDPRALGLEFLLQMASQFPPGKVDVDSIAGSIERAIYEWAKKQSASTNWIENYWVKVHSIVAAICGKRDTPGSLMAMVLDGCFEVPEKLVAISDDLLTDSFEGKPVVFT
jgi:hypothetical protein